MREKSVESVYSPYLMVGARYIEAGEYLRSVASNGISAPAQHNEKREEYSSHLRYPSNIIRLQTILNIPGMGKGCPR
jgi:hypothetical protein